MLDPQGINYDNSIRFELKDAGPVYEESVSLDANYFPLVPSDKPSPRGTITKAERDRRKKAKKTAYQKRKRNRI